MKKAVIFCLFFLICSLIFAQNRFALLIGNSNYLDPEERLPNAINDTQDIKEALEGLGFKVELKHDLKRLDLIKEVAAFINRLKSNRNSEGFFWYAGHGFEIEGKIYLLPVDVVMDVDREDDIEIKANSFPVTDLTDLLSLTRNKINIIVLDTCREPSGKNRGAGDTSRVIKNVPNFPAETLVIFSTAPGKTSDDGKGKNSPFTEAFLTNIKSTEPVVQMMGHVTTQTLSLTRQKQHPYLISNLGRENVSYTLNNNVSLPPPPPPPPPPFPFSNGLRHEIIANYIAITGYTGTSPTLVIPDRIQNLPVTMIAEKAFENNKTLTSITIPSSVTVIGDSAFDSCSNLTNITIPSSVLNIGKWAFFSTNLSSITIPSSVTIINLGTFSNCTNLSSITIPSSVTSIGSSAFSSCSKLPNITIPSSVTSIGSSAFSGCSKLPNITIPSSVTKIEASAFDYCSMLSMINVDNRNTYFSAQDGVLFDYDKQIIIRYPIGKYGNSYAIPSSVRTIGPSAFDSSNLTNVIIPSSVTNIGRFAFYSCKGLTSIIIPSSVTSIDASAFSYCENLTNITIPSSVTSIGSSAFSSCSKLPNITIPSSVTKIEASAFDYCSMLSMINVDNRNTYFSAQDGVLFDYDKQIIIRYPIGKYGNSYAIPSSVRTIGPGAFDSSNLTSVIIPSSVTNIGRFAFYSCKGLTSIIIPSSVTSIDASAFSYCENLTSITIPSSVTSIGSRAFSYCSKLSSVTISRRTQLKEDVFPSSVKIIFSD